jgi:hypothetical protein
MNHSQNPKRSLVTNHTTRGIPSPPFKGGARGGVMKSWRWIWCSFMLIRLRNVPPFRRGGRGGLSVDTAVTNLPSSFSEGANARHGQPANPPCPPFARGGRSVGTQQKHMSLSDAPSQSTPRATNHKVTMILAAGLPTPRECPALFGAGLPTPPECPTEGLPEALTTTAKRHPRAFAAGPGTHSLALRARITRSHAPRGNAAPGAPRRPAYHFPRVVREHHS